MFAAFRSARTSSGSCWSVTGFASWVIGTFPTKTFLDYFSLKKLDDLPPLADLSDWESLRVQLDLPDVEAQLEAGGDVMDESGGMDLPVLFPEGQNDSDAATGEDELSEAEEPVEEEQESEGSGEELVVREWPDPLG